MIPAIELTELVRIPIDKPTSEDLQFIIENEARVLYRGVTTGALYRHNKQTERWYRLVPRATQPQ